MMSERTEFGGWPDPDAQARGWLVRLKSGEATQHDLDMLAGWRSESAQNEQSFRRAVRLWDDLGPALTGGAVGLAGNRRSPADPGRPASNGVSRRWVLSGAGGLAATAAVVLFVGGTPVPAGAQVFETRKGERRRLQLEGQVGVDLNTDSRLFYWAHAVAPRVALDRGEAILSATCDDGRYLRADAHDVEVRAQTARFLFRSDGGVVRVGCLEGRLTIRSGGKDYPLTSGMEADFRGDVPQLDSADVSESDLAWQRDLLHFKDKPAGEVVAELNRYRPGRVYLPSAYAKVRISGVIHLERADLAVDHIARSLGLEVTRLPGGIAVLSAA
jgi:transmembrane sensor